jgi:hypothetical protein
MRAFVLMTVILIGVVVLLDHFAPGKCHQTAFQFGPISLTWGLLFAGLVSALMWMVIYLRRR